MEIIKSTFDIAKPEESLKVAEILQRFVKEKKLTANIKGKEYPLVEAWCFAGSQLGLYPIVAEVKDISNERETKYSAWVEVRRISDNQVMSRGFAICSNKESSKRLFDEYAILSMAQTRAEGKAFRMLLSWIMKAAGFEATPAEEMDFGAKPAQDIEDVPSEAERQLLRKMVYNSTLSPDKREAALESIDICADYKHYEAIQHKLETLQIPIDQLQNPLQGDINTHLKKVVR